MQLKYAWICLDCEEILDARDIKNDACPRCGGRALRQITKWILQRIGESRPGRR